MRSQSPLPSCGAIEIRSNKANCPRCHFPCQIKSSFWMSLPRASIFVLRFRLVRQCKYWSKNYHRNESRHQPELASHPTESARQAEWDGVGIPYLPKTTTTTSHNLGFAAVHCVYLLCGSMESLFALFSCTTPYQFLYYLWPFWSNRALPGNFSPHHALGLKILLIVLKVVLNIVLWDQSDWSTSFLPLNLSRNHVCALLKWRTSEVPKPATPPKWCFPFAKECDIGAMNRVNEWRREALNKVLKNSYLVSAEKQRKKYDITPPELRSQRFFVGPTTLLALFGRSVYLIRSWLFKSYGRGAHRRHS